MKVSFCFKEAFSDISLHFVVANLLCLFASECYHTNVVKRVLVSIIINQGGYKCFQLFKYSMVKGNISWVDYFNIAIKWKS